MCYKNLPYNTLGRFKYDSCQKGEDRDLQDISFGATLPGSLTYSSMIGLLFKINPSTQRVREKYHDPILREKYSYVVFYLKRYGKKTSNEQGKK